MSDSLRIALAQRNFLVGDVQGNAAQVIECAQHARRELAADLVLFPELTLSGYPPEDLLFHSGFRRQVEAGLARVCAQVRDVDLMFGFPEYTQTAIYNSAAYVSGGKVAAIHRKAELPNYRVFDEKRYFQPGSQPSITDCHGVRAGLLVCEDIWAPQAAQLSRADGAQILLVINASPYEIHKQREREQVARTRARDVGLPLVYVNLVGGQDELVFDGNSFVMDAQGEVVMRAPAFAEGTYVVEFARTAAGAVVPRAGTIAPELSDEASVYGALVLGVRDYVRKHGFPGVVIGLSGGVDSALTLAIAVDALGARVRAGGDDALALHLADEPGRREGAGAGAGRAVQRAVHREHVRGDARDAQGRVRRAPGRCRRGEHAVALPHAAAHGAVQQDRAHAA